MFLLFFFFLYGIKLPIGRTLVQLFNCTFQDRMVFIEHLCYIFDSDGNHSDESLWVSRAVINKGYFFSHFPDSGSRGETTFRSFTPPMLS